MIVNEMLDDDEVVVEHVDVVDVVDEDYGGDW
jgi:hypothetical protein